MLFLKEDEAISEYNGEDVLIFPLKKDELELLKEDSEKFSMYINLTYEGLDLSTEENNASFEKQYKLLCEDEQNWAFYSYWVVVYLPLRTIVGDLYFKNTPNENGEVEINFEISEKYRNRGIATDALNLVLPWAFSNSVKKVKAEVEKDNIEAIRVLEKNEFKKVGEGDFCQYEKEEK